jgi:predicted Zn finger-like uncharacterized protein
MPILIACPSCGAKLRVSDKLAGKKIKCPKCGNPVIVTADCVQANKPEPVVLELVEPLDVEAVEQDEDEVPAGDEVRVLKRGKAHKGAPMWVYIVAGVLGTGLAIGAFFVALRFQKQNGSESAADLEAKRVVMSYLKSHLELGSNDVVLFSSSEKNRNDRSTFDTEFGEWICDGDILVMSKSSKWMGRDLTYSVKLRWNHGTGTSSDDSWTCTSGDVSDWTGPIDDPSPVAYLIRWGDSSYGNMGEAIEEACGIAGIAKRHFNASKKNDLLGGWEQAARAKFDRETKVWTVKAKPTVAHWTMKLKRNPESGKWVIIELNGI